MHLCSVVAPNQDLTFCAFLIWLVINFAMSSFFVNFREVSKAQPTREVEPFRTCLVGVAQRLLDRCCC